MPGRKPKAESAITLSPEERRGLYAVRRFMGGGVQQKLTLRIPVDVYFQDPMVAASNKRLAFDENCYIPWEPNLADGPTSARFAVVDYDAHTETLTAPARWNKDTDKFLAPDNKVLDKNNAAALQFHQLNVWAIAQRALDFFESGFALGRRIPWGFDGNRLISFRTQGPARTPTTIEKVIRCSSTTSTLPTPLGESTRVCRPTS